MAMRTAWLLIRNTDDALLTKKDNKDVLESLPERMRGVQQFMELFKPSLDYDIVPIHDVYGPTATDPNIQALVVSKETASGGKAGECLLAVVALLAGVHVYWCSSGQMPGGEGSVTIKNVRD
jgi:pantetheine-phosphate adenylyltransferase